MNRRNTVSLAPRWTLEQECLRMGLKPPTIKPAPVYEVRSAHLFLVGRATDTGRFLIVAPPFKNRRDANRYAKQLNTGEAKPLPAALQFAEIV